MASLHHCSMSAAQVALSDFFGQADQHRGVEDAQGDGQGHAHHPTIGSGIGNRLHALFGGVCQTN